MIFVLYGGWLQIETVLHMFVDDISCVWQ
jgi:hypothetical protein